MANTHSNEHLYVEEMIGNENVFRMATCMPKRKESEERKMDIPFNSVTEPTEKQQQQAKWEE